MDIKDFQNPHKLERWSFVWSEIRIILAALALLAGGIPVIFRIAPGLWWNSSMVQVLRLCWIISGIASAYLAYRWYSGGQRVFGGKVEKDIGAFLVSVISGINLGLAGILYQNIGMSITRNYLVFVIVAVIYLLSALHLWQRWKTHGEKLF